MQRMLTTIESGLGRLKEPSIMKKQSESTSVQRTPSPLYPLSSLLESRSLPAPSHHREMRRGVYRCIYRCATAQPINESNALIKVHSDLNADKIHLEASESLVLSFLVSTVINPSMYPFLAFPSNPNVANRSISDPGSDSVDACLRSGSETVLRIRLGGGSRVCPFA
jgi:hypothetical protein